MAGLHLLENIELQEKSQHVKDVYRLFLNNL